jgi:hypothetical protein
MWQSFTGTDVNNDVYFVKSPGFLFIIRCFIDFRVLFNREIIQVTSFHLSFTLFQSGITAKMSGGTDMEISASAPHEQEEQTIRHLTKFSKSLLINCLFAFL